MRKLAAAYFGIVGIFVAMGLLVQATESTLQRSCTITMPASGALQLQTVVLLDPQPEWQHRLDNLHW